MTPTKFEISLVIFLSLVIGLTILLLSCGNSIQAAAQVTSSGNSSSASVIIQTSSESTPEPLPVSTPLPSLFKDNSISHTPLEMTLTAGVDLEDVILLYDSTQPYSFDTNFCKMADFYGLRCKKLNLDNVEVTVDQLQDLNGNYFKLIGIASGNFVSANSSISDQELQVIRSAVSETGAVLFLSGTDADMDLSRIKTFTNGVVSGINHTASSISGWNISDNPDISLSFAGQTITYFSTDTKGYFSIEYAETPAATTIINAVNMDGTENPVFIRWENGSGSVLIDSTAQGFDLQELPLNQYYYDPKYFSEMMPLMYSFQYALPDEIWHNDHYYANLTIDDPVLTVNFYELSFSQLLQQMKEHNFHTTIAYRPGLWQQFDIETVKLIEENSAQYSLVQHGNNHDGYEFYKYSLGMNDPKNNPDLRARPLAEQEEDIIAGLKRISEIQKSLKLIIEPVMIFPYGISPEQTLVLLKKYNYLASVSQQNIPLDAAAPAAWDFEMRPAETYYGNFPSIMRRHPGSYLPFKSDFQPFLFDLFLGKPAVFYSHAREEIFAEGITGFNTTADKVNNLHIPVEWRSLGYILSRLYQEKTEDDGSISIQMYTRKLFLENNSTSSRVYHIYKNELLNVPSISITAASREYPYQVQDGILRMDILVPAAETVEINITYQ